MSYFLADVNGFKGDLATNTGYDDLANWLESSKLDLSKEFVEQGYTEFPKELVMEIDLYIDQSTEYWLNPELKNTVDNFKEMLLDSKDVAIISNGEG